MEKNGIVSVWAVCGFGADELDEYTEYDYENDCPSRFCIENSISADDIDEDFIEKSVFDRTFTDITELLVDFSYSGSFVSALDGKKLPDNCCGAIAVYDYEHEGNKAENADVVFIGSAEYSE